MPHGASLQLKALAGQSFDAKCLAAPADAPFTIAFENVRQAMFGPPHNFSIYTDATATEALFRGKILQNGGKTVYQVDAIPAGVYLFQCDLHPAIMNGVFVVK